VQGKIVSASAPADLKPLSRDEVPKQPVIDEEALTIYFAPLTAKPQEPADDILDDWKTNEKRGSRNTGAAKSLNEALLKRLNRSLQELLKLKSQREGCTTVSVRQTDREKKCPLLDCLATF